jgi:hypothetical protein
MSTSKGAWVRFPNTSYFEEILHFDWDKFTPTNEFDDEVFGTYAGMTIAIKKEKNDEQIRQTISRPTPINS